MLKTEMPGNKILKAKTLKIAMLFHSLK